MKTKLPRIMIAAPGSGLGKTMLTCALLAAWKEKGLRLISYNAVRIISILCFTGRP